MASSRFLSRNGLAGAGDATTGVGVDEGNLGFGLKMGRVTGAGVKVPI